MSKLHRQRFFTVFAVLHLISSLILQMYVSASFKISATCCLLRDSEQTWVKCEAVFQPLDHCVYRSFQLGI